MFRLPGYEIGEMLYESPSSLVYRAIRSDDGRPVILKTLRGGFPSPSDVARYHWEYEILKKVSLNGVPTVLSLIESDSRPTVVMDDIGGSDLGGLLRQRTFTLAEKLSLAADAAGILESIHGAGLIHLDIKLSNIVCNIESNQVQIIDFGSSRSTSFRNTDVDMPLTFRGTPSYMSPEYTGRLNRAVDYRSDLYSFGVTLYEFFTDHLPFETDDPLEMMHSHIARIPVRPAEVNPELPAVLSDMIMKLLAKAPRDRYQSARGVTTDLKACLDRLSREGKINSFSLARHDVSANFEIPHNLIGRERERDLLLSSYKRTVKGERQAVFIHGAAGVGKTSLMLDIQRNIAETGGLFTYGAFNASGGLGPFSALVSAIKELTLRLLSQGEATLAQWRERLQIALGRNCRVITDLIPEAEQVLGKQPPVEELEPAAARLRQQRVLLDLIRALCRPEQPLVLCLDHIQWADSTAQEFLVSLMTGDEIDFFQLIGAFRTDGNEPAGAWDRFVSRCKESGIEIAEIPLGPLSRDHTTQMISKALHTDREVTMPLADLVLEKTGGNPFFIREFLGVLNDESLITFDSHKGGWTWNIEGIRDKGFTDNVVDLMVRGLEKLNHETQTTLKTAAVMGTRFDAITVAVLSGVTEEEITNVLADAENGGLIVKRAPKDDPVCELCRYQFVHDRVRDAAYALIPADEKSELHYRLGRYLWRTLSEDERTHHILEIADHLNVGSGLIMEESERRELAGLNLEATRWARKAGRFRAAHKSARAGLALCNDGWWSTDYDLLLALHLEAMESAYLAGDYAEMKSLGRAALSKAKTVLDQVRIFKIRVDACMVRNHWPEAVSIALEALRVLGIPLDSAEEWSPETVGEKFKNLLAGRTIDDLRDLPPMGDPLSQLALRIMTRAAAAFSSVTPELAPFLIHEQIRLCLEHGNAPESASSYMYLAVLLCSQGDIDSAYDYGRLALDMADRVGGKSQRVSVGFLYNFLIRHWKEHLSETISPLQEVHQAGLESGDIFPSTYSLVYRSVHLFFMGRPLDESDRAFEDCGRIMLRIGQRDAFNFVGMFRQAIANLRGNGGDPVRLIGDYYDEDKMLAMVSEADNRGRDYGLYFNKVLLGLVFGRYDEVLRNVGRLQSLGEEFSSTATWPLYFFGEALARSVLHREGDAGDGSVHLDRIILCLEKLENWNRFAPMNIGQKYLLVKAEYTRISGRIQEAAELYDQAISAAKANGYLQDEALANEAAADFYLKRDRATIGRSYLMEARYAYLRWGASAKVTEMEERHSELLMGAIDSPSAGHAHLTLTTSSTPSDKGCDFDLASAFRAAQVVSSEIVLDRLLGKLMNIVMQNAGAEKAFLVLENDDRLEIRAQAWSDGRTVLPEAPLAVEDSPELASAIVTYVARTRNPVVLDDAARHGRFKNEPYIARNGIRSVLSLPMINKNRLTGVLYLENNLSTGVFTSEHLESLGWLSTQAAISLENARLYQKLTDYSQWLENIVSALNVAQEVQQGLLPWRAPELEGLDIAGRSLYCDETGGDYYDYIESASGKPDRLAVVIGDVSGHGVSAALLMSTTRAYLRSLAIRSERPAEVVTGVNALVAADVRETGQFVTLFYLEIDSASREIVWVRAGQDPAVRYSPVTDTFEQLGGPGLALGVEEAWKYSQFTDIVEPGQIIVLGTDGVWETRNDRGEMFGKQRLKDVIRRNAKFSAEGMRQAVVDAVTDFRGRAPQQDDVTLVVIKFN
jgi:predicted ATPase/serine phosphatase RsbU (regulator of sigma subunit)